MELDAAIWETYANGDGTTTLIARNAVGTYVVPTTKLDLATRLLNPAEITKVLDGIVDHDRCTCPLGLGMSRCYHKFSYNQIAKVRGEWITSLNPAADTANILKGMNAGAADRHQRLVYKLQGHEVCRTFFANCIGIPMRVLNQIVALVRGLPLPERAPRRRLPTYDVPNRQYDVCVAFWQQFFGEQCQTSQGEGHRYYPVNLSAFYIYHNYFWPWWNDVNNNWTDDSQDCPPTSDPALNDALTPLRVPTTKEDIDRLFQDFSDEDDAKHAEPEAVDDTADVSPELQDLFNAVKKSKNKEDVKDFLDDALLEDQAMKTLKLLQREVGFPSYATFMRGRYDKQFADVKRREKHFHCRCPTCHDLQTTLLKAAKSKESRLEYTKLLKDHHYEVKRWRQLETNLQMQAKSAPDVVTVLSYDDTSAMGFPRMTNRDIKSMPNDRVYMTPFN